MAPPRLERLARFELMGTLSALGMLIAFSDRAAVPGMAGSPGGALQISRVVHEAYVRVGEAGTEAAAAAAGIVVTPGAPRRAIVFDVDCPFVFVLRDTATGAVLFAGTVSQP